MNKSSAPVGPLSLWRERGGSFLNPALAYLAAVWVTHAILRAALLFRKDPYGFAFVGKPDWYIFHALAIDGLWILGYSFPALALLAVFGAAGLRAAGRVLLGALMVFHSLLLWFTVCDHETMRFLGMHLDPSLLSTYGNGAALREVSKFLASDLSLRYLPYGLFLACVPFSLLLFRGMLRYFRWTTRERLLPWVLGTTLASSLVFHVFLAYIWPGGFRMLKLRAFPATVMQAMARRGGAGSEAVDVSGLGRIFQDRWLLEQGDSGYVFPDPSHPYYKEPLSVHCARAFPSGTAPDSRCAQDGDGDGFRPAEDCDDGDPGAYPAGRGRPAAADLPGNGVDEDCDGADKKPMNMVFFILESHRAVNVGFLRPHGALAGATPFLDSLAAGARVWTRFSAAGVPTINALMATHLSILQHPTRYIASDFTGLRHRSFSEVLGRHGYLTRFFSAADPSWDGQVPWLRQWYQGLVYDRTRERDHDMLDHMAEWMLDSLGGDRPFLISCITKTNHYPFNPEPGVRLVPEGAGLQERMLATMEYTDEGLRRFMAAVASAPWFANTLFIFMADHGFPLSEHGSSTIGYGLYTESTWIPFLIFGNHPELGEPGGRDYPAGQLDIGPTLLDLAGIREPDHYLGHSLARPAAGKYGRNYVLRGEQGVLEDGSFRIHGPLGEIPREQGPEVFNVLEDRLEKRNLYPKAEPLYDSLLPFLRDLGKLNTRLIETDAIWPDTAGPGL